MVDLVHIGLIGCGRWGQYILRDLHTLGCSVTVLARSENSRQRATQLGAARIVSDLKELRAVDGFVIATPTATHAEMLERLIPMGVPIFVEKPLTADVLSAERIARTTDQVFVMDKWRYHPGVRMLAEIARSEELGETLGLRYLQTRLGQPAYRRGRHLDSRTARPVHCPRDSGVHSGTKDRHRRGHIRTRVLTGVAR
ncbi:MAG: Gfo/Idh/MocA family oxidoreductase [Pleurocapsa sp. SU_196_0]|nr:Gfo/Idh/MocA family oxidoreductase [Pleurocapsa sp. SU_196_0]